MSTYNEIADQIHGVYHRFRLTLNGNILDDIPNNVVFNNMANDSAGLEIGTAYCSKITFEITDPGTDIANQEVLLEDGVRDSDGSFVWSPIGYFMATDAPADRGVVSYTLYDRMAYKLSGQYTTSLAFPTTDKAVIEDICSRCGVTMVGSLTAHTISTMPTGTNRDVLASMLQLQGKNACFNASGQLEIKWYTDSGYTVKDSQIYYDGDASVKDPFVIGFIKNKRTVSKTVTKEEEQTDYDDNGNEVIKKVSYAEETSEEQTYVAGDGLQGVSFENPYMTQDIVNELYEKLKTFSYTPTAFRIVGDFRIRAMDIITVTTGGKTYKVPVMCVDHSCDGGLTDNIYSYGQSESASTVNEGSSNSKAFARYDAELAYLKTIYANTLNANKASILYAEIKDLNATNAAVKKLDAETVKTTELEASVARFGYITAASVEAQYARLDKANIGVGWIDSAMIGEGVVGTVQIADGSITDAKIVGMTANKITAGTIDAANIEVVNLNAANITVGTINGQQISSGAIDKSKLDSALSGTIDTMQTDVEQALEDAGLASTAAAAAQSAASNAVSIASGKTTAYYQESQPTGGIYTVNDHWFDTDDGYKMYYYSGSEWVAAQYGADAIAASAVTAGKIASGAVTSDKIAANAVVAGKIAADAVTAGTIAAGAVTADKVAADAITAEKISSNAVTSDKIVSGAVTADKIAANAVTANKILAGAVTTEKINTKAITADKLNVSDLSAISARIGGWELGTGYIRDKDTSGRYCGIGRNGVTQAFYAGGTAADGSNGVFRVGHDGSLTATNAVISGNIVANTFKLTKGNYIFWIDETAYTAGLCIGTIIYKQNTMNPESSDPYLSCGISINGETVTVQGTTSIVGATTISGALTTTSNITVNGGTAEIKGSSGAGYLWLGSEKAGWYQDPSDYGRLQCRYKTSESAGWSYTNVATIMSTLSGKLPISNPSVSGTLTTPACVVSSSLTLNNGVPFYAKNSAGTSYGIFTVSASNNFHFGYGLYDNSYSNVYYSGNTVYVRAKTHLYRNLSWEATSDARLKHDIADIPDALLNAYMDFEPKHFIWNDNPGLGKQSGVIAQQVLTALINAGADNSNIVTQTEDVETYGFPVYTVNYDAINVLTMAVTQRQERRIKALEEEVAKLKAQLSGYAA